MPLLRLLRHLRRPPTIAPDLWRDARNALPWLHGLNAEREHRLRHLAARFLHEKAITPVAGLQLDDVQRCMLAALCCLPMVEFGAEGLKGWSQLIVYPDAFRVDRSHVDAAGVLHEWEDELAGEAWEAGPVILSWADVLADCEDPRAGSCVAAHEIAHKLDLLDGVLDGTPALPRAWQREWARDFKRTYDRFVERVDAGEETAIDSYAAQAPDEFFAVASEYHFSDPQLLREQMPEVARHLERFYGPAPFGASDR
ncbi:zinc-dependent peptidase [Montanilutibacter psychrotolerans]|uniref:Zinc-dependent peptidase n=1 Tax=Montanilutibacter psychrotolerans TaxID=1327343 RepID=A0A3M8SLC5_9GAMM|nr:M90 family metallopeptidase [Lysobacter psychrotolerans]RNF82177.1 zinc-dependent peptidase [Lysobacter psychrotolerans]